MRSAARSHRYAGSGRGVAVRAVYSGVYRGVRRGMYTARECTRCTCGTGHLFYRRLPPFTAVYCCFTACYSVLPHVTQFYRMSQKT